MYNEIALALKELLSLVRELNDPKMRKAIYDLRMFKQYRKAVNVAEEAFDISARMFILVDVPEKNEKKFNKLMDDYQDKINKFNQLD